jgi:glycosyltransferase involved in cell wall biosynthesis
MLARQAPVVWTLHDMNPFTGGCHYAGFCEKYLCACGRCPQLGSRRWRDGSHGMWQRRKAAYQEIEKKRMVVVSPSDWLRHCAEQSALLHGIPKEVIPYGVDTELFRPMEKARARRALGLPGDERLVLFPAPGIPGRKGWENLQGAAFRMDQSTPWRILVTGGSRPRAGNPAVADLGTLRSESAMARAYAASDLVALPSREDNFPNTLLEAMACGRPVVAFATGGIPEIVRHGATGLLARTGDERELSECLRSLLTDPCACNRMGQAARDVAVEEYGAALQAERYLALYRRMLGSASP